MLNQNNKLRRIAGTFYIFKKFLQDNYNMTGNEKQVFKDYSKQGKDRKWRERKLKNIELAGRLEKLGYRSFERVYQCAEVLKFIEQQDGTKKLYQSYFVKINFVQYVTGDGQ